MVSETKMRRAFFHRARECIFSVPVVLVEVADLRFNAVAQSISYIVSYLLIPGGSKEVAGFDDVEGRISEGFFGKISVVFPVAYRLPADPVVRGE